MNRTAPAWLMLLAIATGQEVPRALPVEPAGPPPRASLPVPGTGKAESRSGQFRVTGADPVIRGSVALLAEEAKEDLLKLTGEKDEWKVQVNITLHGKRGDPSPARTVVMNLLVIEGGYDLRMDIHLGLGLDKERFLSAITEAMLYERAIRGRPANQIPDRPMVIPPWLAEGLREATDWRMNRSNRRIYEGLFKRGGLYKLDQLFAVNETTLRELDSGTRTAFRASSGALVMALLRQPNGREGFRAFLSEAPSFEGEMPLLMRNHFPELNLSETSLAKWWQLQMADNTTAPATDTLGIAETEAALVEALFLNIRGEGGVILRKPLSDWAEAAAMKDADRLEAVRLAEDGLVRLSYRCFPSFRPILTEYQTILAAIARGKTGKVAEQLAALDENRTIMVGKANRGRDYLDWFEITRARETSGEFDDYLELKERLQANPLRRADNISGYLDQMERIFDRGDRSLSGPK